MADAVGVSLAIFIAVPSNAAPATWTNAATAAQALVLGYVLLKVRGTPSPSVGALWALVAAFGVGAVYASSSDALLDVAKFGLTVLPIAMVARRLDGTGQRHLARWVIWLAVVEAVLALTQKLYATPAIWGWVGIPGVPTAGVNPLWAEPAGRAMGSMGHAIPLGLLLGAAAILAVLSAALERRSTQGLTVALMFAGAMAAGSRSAIIVTAVVLTFALLAFPNRLRNFWTVWATSFVVVYVIVFVDLRQLTLVESLSGSASLTVRQSSWNFFGQLWDERSFVENIIGSADIQTLRAKGFFDPQFAIDNNFVTVFALAGAVGLALLLAIIVGALRWSAPVGLTLSLFVVGMFFAFDIVQWQFPTALLVVALYGFRKPVGVSSPSAPDAAPKSRSPIQPRHL